MKLLFVITRADTVGGAQVHVRDLAKASKALKDKVAKVLVVTGSKGLYTEELEKLEIDYISLNSLQRKLSLVQDWHALNFLQQTIREFKPDVISTHSSKAGILGRVAAKITNTPCIFTAHGWAFTGGVPEPSRTIYQWLERIAAPLADRIICVSEHDRAIGIQNGMEPHLIQRIYNGMPDISPQLRANPSQGNPVRIVMIARFDRQKDHVTLLEAFKEISGAELDLVGDGPNLEAIKTLAAKLSVTNRVNFLGYSSNVASVLKTAHIFTLISNWEGFPITTIEAMRAGLPVVVSKVGGAWEAVIEGVTGYSVERGDVQSLHQRLLQLVSDAELRRKMGNEGRKRYEAQFTFGKMFESTVKVYEQVLAERKINQ